MYLSGYRQNKKLIYWEIIFKKYKIRQKTQREKSSRARRDVNKYVTLNSPTSTSKSVLRVRRERERERAEIGMILYETFISPREETRSNNSGLGQIRSNPLFRLGREIAEIISGPISRKERDGRRGFSQERIDGRARGLRSAIRMSTTSTPEKAY